MVIYLYYILWWPIYSDYCFDTLLHYLDPCVRLNVIIGSKCVSKRKTETHINQTEPSFDELFVFNVPKDKLDKVRFLVIVTDETDSVLSPVGHTPANEIGRVLLGDECSWEANVHWDEVKKQPRRPIAYLYPLYWKWSKMTFSSIYAVSSLGYLLYHVHVRGGANCSQHDVPISFSLAFTIYLQLDWVLE